MYVSVHSRQCGFPNKLSASNVRHGIAACRPVGRCVHIGRGHVGVEPIATSSTVASRFVVFKILVTQILSPQFLGVLFYVLLRGV